MPNVTTKAEQMVLIDGEQITIERVQHALTAAWMLALAYARADADNGGFESVEWAHLNEANAEARLVLKSTSRQR